VVLADSHGISRVPCYLGTPQGDQLLFAYGTITLCGPNFHNGSAKHWFCNSLEGLLPFRAGPTTPLQHRQQAVPLQRFRLIPFRSPLLRKSLLLSVPRGTEMFQFPRFPPLGLFYSAQGDRAFTPAGFPHSDIHGSKPGRRLPVAYRSHPRPSSASGAKASTVGSL
jgi:hypothetical protein